ncbi:MAG: hypothetical protein B7Y40_00870 [Gammaproteobacteria bacterium 28-57-27]|nr:MAG: hypothetical protein B7Y40_00870 [Gammaproteobacteria bacterium 28-57-27]
MSKPEEHRPNPKLASSAFTHLVGTFKDRISGMFDQVVDVLLGMAEKSASVKDQHLYFDSMRTLRQSRGEIIEVFEQNLSAMGKDPNALEKLKTTASIDTLELVSDDTMSENVTLSNLAQRITNRAGDEINALDIRIDSISSDDNVVSITPEIALRALEAALRKASLEFETRQVVYQIIEQQAVHSLANVYAEMNQWMINQGVMPRIPLGYVRRGVSGRRKSMAEPMSIPTEAEAARLRSFADDVQHNTEHSTGEPIGQPLHEMPTAGASPLRHFSLEADAAFETAATGYSADIPFTPGAASSGAFSGAPPGASAYGAPGPGGGAHDWPWNGEISELHIPWLSQQLEKLKSHERSPIAQAITRISPALNAAASKDLSILHDRRHPMRRALTLLEDLVIDLDSEDGLDDIGGEITQMIGLMESRAASGPGFWLHVVKYLNYLKEELHGRLWSDNVDADHQERVRLARRLATRQIQLLMRDKRVTPALQRILTQMLGPALAILMLRHRHDRDSQVLRSAIQLIHDVIESVQGVPESLEDMHYLEHASGKALIQQLYGFFMGFSGFDQNIIAETLLHLEQEHTHILNTLASRNNQVTLPSFSAHSSHGGLEDHTQLLQLPTLPSPPLIEDIETAEFTENPPPRIETEAPQPKLPTPTAVPAKGSFSLPSSSSASLDNISAPAEPDLAALNNLALDALLEKLNREYRFTWFQVPACEGCNLRRLMFGAYDHARRLVMFCNVRQEPSLSISVVDFDLGLKAGVTRPIYDEPGITHLLKDYLKSCAASA